MCGSSRYSASWSLSLKAAEYHVACALGSDSLPGSRRLAGEADDGNIEKTAGAEPERRAHPVAEHDECNPERTDDFRPER